MHDAEIELLLRSIERECRFTAPLTGKRQLSPAVLQALAQVPREEFVPAELQRCAYADTALPIGQGQTISQPFIVALMTELLDPRPDDRILEVGTGSGYQAAVLARLVRRVVSVEILPELGADAARRLARLGFANVEVHIGDGYAGWPPEAPYDGIIVTAATPRVPAPLLEQLRPGGRLVLPLGPPSLGQELTVMEQDREGRFSSRSVLGVAFVPLIRHH